LPSDKSRPSGSATLLGVVVGEHHTLLGDAIDVRRLVSHYTERVGADIRLPDVVAEDNEDVWFLGGRW
jgi:hypothetical protein